MKEQLYFYKLFDELLNSKEQDLDVYFLSCFKTFNSSGKKILGDNFNIYYYDLSSLLLKTFFDVYKSFADSVRINYLYFIDGCINIFLNPLLLKEKDRLKKRYLEAVEKYDINSKEELFKPLFLSFLNDVSNDYGNNQKFIGLTKDFSLELSHLFKEFIATSKKDLTTMFNLHYNDIVLEISDYVLKIKEGNYNLIEKRILTLLQKKRLVLLKEKNQLIIERTKQQFSNLLKFIKGKNKNRDYLILHDYVLSYQNVLFRKLEKILISFDKIVDLSLEERGEKVKNLSDFSYQLFKLDYCFDRPFLDFYKNFLSHGLLSSRIVEKEVKKCLDEMKTSLSSDLKDTLISAYQEYFAYFLHILHDGDLVKLKCSSFTTYLTNKDLDNYFA